MGALWLSMIAFFTLGMVLWFGVGLGVAGFIVGVVPMVLLRGRWDRLMNNYRESMFRSERYPFSVRDWSLVSEKLVHVVRPSRPARSRPAR